MKLKNRWWMLLLLLVMLLSACGSNEAEIQSLATTTMEEAILQPTECNNGKYLFESKELNLYEGILSYTRCFEYDVKDRIKKEIIYYSNITTNATTEVIMEFSYINDVLAKILCYQDGVEVYLDEQNGDKGLLECEFSIEEYKLAFKYYSNGKVCSEYIIKPDGEWVYAIDYLYDRNGNLLEDSLCYLNEKSSYAEAVWTIREYINDTDGNRIAMCFRQENSGTDGYYNAGLVRFTEGKIWEILLMRTLIAMITSRLLQDMSMIVKVN